MTDPKARTKTWEPKGRWWSITAGYDFGKPFVRPRGKIPLDEWDEFMDLMEEAADYAEQCERAVEEVEKLA